MSKKQPYKNKYLKKYAEQLPSMFANGESVEEVCQELGISRRAFYDWVEKHSEFADAYEMGKQASHAWWLKLGRAGATGKVDVQPTLWIFNMKNRLGWKDKVEVEQESAAEPLNISFEVSEAKTDVKVTRGAETK